jgi:hypothetical protein
VRSAVSSAFANEAAAIRRNPATPATYARRAWAPMSTSGADDQRAQTKPSSSTASIGVSSTVK